MTKNTVVKLRNKKAWTVAQVQEKGFMSYKQIMSVTGWDLNNLHSTFRANVLEECGLVKVTMGGRKGFTLSNKSKAAKLILTNHKSTPVAHIADVTGWDSHVLNSVFRKQVLSGLGIEKAKIGKIKVYRVA